MKPSHFHALYNNGRPDPQFEDADEDGTYLSIPGLTRVFNTSGPRFASGSRALLNPNSVFSAHTAAPSAIVPTSHHVMVGHSHDSHRSLLLQSAMMNQAVANHSIVAAHHSSLRGATAAADSAYLANAAMFHRPWRPQQALVQDHHIALAGALQGRTFPYRTSPPQARLDGSNNSERHHISREILTSMLRDSLIQDSSRNLSINERIIEHERYYPRILVATGQSDNDHLKESLHTPISQEMFSASRHLMSKGVTAPQSQSRKHSLEESGDVSGNSSRMKIVRPSEVITAAMLKSAQEKEEKDLLVAQGIKKETRGDTKTVDRNMDWKNDVPETGFGALLAASFQADCATERKRKIGAEKVDNLAIGKKAKNGVVTSESLDSNVTEFTTVEWRCASVPLSLAEDKHWLSDLQCYIRLNFVEAFGATEEDLSLSIQGRSRPTFIGQVGIRCLHCKNMPSRYRGHLHAFFPTSMAGIYNCVQGLLRTHLACCRCVPEEVREKIGSLKTSSSARGGRKQYWIDSAKRLGMNDTSRGIIFEKEPLKCKAGFDAAEVISRARVGSCTEESSITLKETAQPDLDSIPGSASTDGNGENTSSAVVSYPPLVFPEDKHLISEVLYVTFQNLHKVPIVESDQIGCYKNRPLGFVGLSCNYCVGQAGCGRYFPANEASLSQTTTSQTLLNHVRKCRKAPVEVGLKLESLMRAKLQKSEKPRHGGRKIFFHRLWCRMQGLPVSLNEEDALESNICKDDDMTGNVNQKMSTNESDYDVGIEIENDVPNEDFGTKTGVRGNEEPARDKVFCDSENENVDEFQHVRRTTRVANSSVTYFSGKIPLAQPNDAYWLSDLMCFVRNECLEAFSATSEDVHSSSGKIVQGQVGIRCKFCSTSKRTSSVADHVAYPTSINEVEAMVAKITEAHLARCPLMPESSSKTFKYLREFGSPSKTDTKKYWVDAAKETGMSDGHDGTVRFFRDPSAKGAAERLFLSLDEDDALEKPQSVVRKRDKKSISDHLFFLLSQVQICSYDEHTDQRRGRAKILEKGFRGVECIHCAGKGTKKGRYFPVSAKLFCDGTSPNILSHLLACEFCPEDIKASLEYLNHRTSDENVRLKSGWRKSYYSTLWKRIHEQNSYDDNEPSESDEETVSENSNSGSDNSDGESSLDFMMIDAAARWLTELGQAVVEENGKKRRVRKQI